MSVTVSAVTRDIVVRTRHGRHPVRISLERELNWNGMNARLVLRAMGLENDDLVGEASIADARRAVILGRNRRRVTTREDEEGEGAQGCRFVSPGLDELGVRRRVQEFGLLVEEAARKGATHITWS